MKIALVGSHPETWKKAPFDDFSWEIWGFSRRNFAKLPRFDLWFELHPKTHFRSWEINSPGYVEWLLDQPNRVTQPTFPWEHLKAEFGPYFFAHGQVPWMMAYAIEQQPETIGLWGIEGAESYQGQRPEIHYFASVARYRGIEVIAPETNLLEPPKFYAFS